ncbi:gliding motility protein GldL [Chryseobacterium salivictor]|uniref:Gliding motility protein GldL n=1 Tax=Chryseobacterium salivictor TaxID=2547600 RepID=A0A4P6ZFU6_9FLAO|nr:gliding motility protein GldL [Chryseobacterium salivictor]QBO58438.1 hypothetical protein NBC122_01623 [Chryseobacterium salivictor]
MKNKKTKHALIIFLIGFLINMIGAFFKITHWSFGSLSGNVILAIGSIFQTIGILLLLYKLFTSPKFKEFLKW